jgi:hypothetical protein
MHRLRRCVADAGAARRAMRARRVMGRAALGAIGIAPARGA